MQVRKRFFLWLSCGIVFLCASMSFAQNFTTPIHVSDGFTTYNLSVGVNSSANYASGDSLSPSLVEREQPPKPPTGVFDARLVDPRNPATGFGQGLLLDLRDYVDAFQIDSFRVNFQASTEAGLADLQFTWDPGLASLGGGLWRLRDGITGTLLDIDMTAQTSVNVPQAYGFVYIIKASDDKFRTFKSGDIASGVDSKGKAKPEKQKPYRSHTFAQFTNTTGHTVTTLNVKWGNLVLSHLNLGGVVATPATGSKVVDYSGFSLPNNGSLTIEVIADKGKYPKPVGKWTSETKPPKVVGVVLGSSSLLWPKPNIHNLTQEMYLQSAFDAANGLTIGIAPKAVIHPKYGDVWKTIKGKGAEHAGTAKCLDKNAKGKDITKPLKACPTTVLDDKLISAAVALRYNIGASATSKTWAGFGQLVYSGDGLDGLTVEAIADSVDKFLACNGSGKTADEWWTIAEKLNGAFWSASFDTASWSPKLTMTGVKAAYMTGFLRQVSSIPPKIIPTKDYVQPLPEVYSLSQNYPNPFNPTTTIEFSLAEDAFVTLKVYNMLGQEVATLLNNESMIEGANEVDFDATSFASGVYYYRLIVNDGQFQQIKKMMLMK